ncbi:MAG: hypothetical protein RLY16_1538 [Bacteroidota bacterium]|jgi:hypothetical protein
MRIFIGYCMLFFCSSNTFAQLNTVGSLQELITSTSSASLITVTTNQDGGIFYHSTIKIEPDFGISFPRKSGGIWVRQFNPALGVNPCWWGAKGDGIQDDLPALQAATQYCLANETILQFPSGVFRITAPWVIGGKTLEEKDLFTSKLTTAESFKIQQHQKARTSNAMIVRGAAKTCIYGDFSAKQLTAMVYYNINANGIAKMPSAQMYSHEFSNIGFYGEGSFDGGVPRAITKVNEHNQQIGLVILYCNQPKINGCNFAGLKYGLLAKTSYFGQLSNCSFRYCETGFWAMDYNANLIENIVGFYCKQLAEISGSQLTFNNINTEFCKSTLKFCGKNIVINGMYCENNQLSLANQYQLILGRNKAEPGYSPKSFTTGIVIQALTITTAGRELILLEDDLRTISITSANMNGSILSKSVRNQIEVNLIEGSIKFFGPGRFLSDRNRE